MSSSRMSIWSVLPPRDAECDLFAPEIAKWMSIVLEKEISSDLLSELVSGDVLCELFVKLCPEIKIGRYHKNASADMLKRDNIQIFANATVKFGVPHSSMLNYSFFESKDMALVITSLLVFVKVLIEKKGAEEIKLPESFIQTIGSAYLETRVLHRKHIDEVKPEEAPSEAVQEKERDLKLSKEDIALLDEMMRNQVNDMLNDIVNERRRTFGMTEEMPEERHFSPLEHVEEESDDSFDERYVMHSSVDPEEDTVMLPADSSSPLEESDDEREEFNHNFPTEPSTEVNESVPVTAEQSIEQSTEQSNQPQTRSSKEVFVKLDDCPPEILDELVATEMSFEEPETMMEDIEEIVNSEEQELQKEEKEEEKKEEKKKGGFWWKTALVAAAVASVVIAKQYHK